MSQPMASRARHWAQINEFSFVAGMRLLLWIWRFFGQWAFRLTLYPVVLWYMITKPAARAASMNYLRRIKNGNTPVTMVSRIDVLRHFASFAESILDKILLWSGLFNTNDVRFAGQESIMAQIAAGRGGLLICCHLGNLDLCRLLARQLVGFKLTVLIHTKHSRVFNRLLGQIDPESQLHLMQVTELSPATAMLLAEKVDRGEFVAIAGDRIPVSAFPRVATAKFLGQTAAFPVGPYILGSIFRCPTYLMFSMRMRRTSEIHFELFRESIDLRRGRREEMLTLLATEYAGRLEHFCRRAPLQWFNFYDFWRFSTVDASRDVSR